MSEMLRFVLTAVCMVGGMLVILLAVFGVFRFMFVMNRMHSAAMIDTLGLFLILVGLCIATGSIQYIPKLVLIICFQWIGSPIASHFVGKLEVETDADIEEFAEEEDDTLAGHAFDDLLIGVRAKEED